MSTINEISRENCREFLIVFCSEHSLTTRKVAKAIGCSEHTLARIVNSKTLPSDEMLRQTGIMLELGFKSYSKLSQAEKEKISEAIGAVGGGAIGFASITAVVSALGYAGLSAAGVASGLSVLGGLVGGGMAAGIGVVTALPMAGIAAGYLFIKGVKEVITQIKLDEERYDPFWERPLEESEDSA